MVFFRHASRSLSVHLSNKSSGPLGVVTHQSSPSYVRHSSNVFVRSLSTTSTTTRTASFAKQQPSPAITSEATEALNASSSPRILDEQTLLSQLSPLKRILCLCPVPLGQKRLSWSGGDSCIGSDENPAQSQTTPVKIHKYRYGEQYEIGVAVSDPYLTHAVPVKLVGGDGRFVAEMVPTFRGDGALILLSKIESLFLIIILANNLTPFPKYDQCATTQNSIYSKRNEFFFHFYHNI